MVSLIEERDVKWRELRAHISQEEDDASMERDGYISFVINDGTIIQTVADRDNDWYTATYIQVCKNDEADEPDIIVIQLEGLPENPTNMLVDGSLSETDIPIKVFKRVT